MGVEYAHGIFVADLMWRPTWRHVEAVTSALDRAGLHRETPFDPTTDLPANLALAYAEITGLRVREIVGPSNYVGVSERDRYILDVVAVFGVDIKRPMTEEYGREIIAWPDGDIDEDPDHLLRTQFVYPATWESPLPKARRPGQFWRSGVVFNCGKNVPAIVNDDDRELVDRMLVQELERAFKTTVVELGWIY
jgi:hypothetical protein